MTPLDLSQIEQAAQLLREVKQHEDAGQKDATDVERESEARTLLNAVLQRNGVDL